MRILGINGGNGVILHSVRKYLIANVEYRPIFKTPKDIQWKLNFGDIPLYNNLKIPISWKTFEGIDVIIGAPDCGHSSVLSFSRAKKLSDPERNESFLLFLEGVSEIQPKVFIMENLSKSLEQYTKGKWRNDFPNYKIIYHECSVAKFGNSQKTRKRLVLVGIRNDTDSTLLGIVEPVHGLQVCGELLANLPKVNSPEGKEICHVNEDKDNTGSTIITLYAGFKASLAYIGDSWVQKDWTRWMVEGRNFSTAPGSYRNRDSEYPSTARKSNRQFNHNGDMMSPRELARIQGVPDKFKLWYEEDKHNYCINKARATVAKTPPYEIGQWIKKQLKAMKKYGHL